MKALYRFLLPAVSAAAMLLGAQAAEAKGNPRVLIYSGSTGYRHASIEPAVAAIKSLCVRQHLDCTASEDPNAFSDASLRTLNAIVFVSDSSDPKKPESEWLVGDRRTALQSFVHRGGGIVGIHAAADSHYNWPWYGKMFGAHFLRHPQGTPTGVATVVDRTHEATKGLPATATRADEWYYFDDYDPTSHVLITVDPATIGQDDANPNPVSWVREFEGGRVFYTAMGHTPETYSEPFFLKHLAGGLNWVLRR